MAKIEKQASQMQRDPLLIIVFDHEDREVFVFPEWADPSDDYTDEDPTIGPWDSGFRLTLGDKRYKVLSGAIAKTRLRLAES